MARQVLIELCFCTGSAGGRGCAREGVEAVVAHGGSWGPLWYDRHLHQLLYRAPALLQMPFIKVLARLVRKMTELCREVELCFPRGYFFFLSSLRRCCSCRCAASAACCRVGGRGGGRAPCQAGVVGAAVLVHGAGEQRQHEHVVTGTSWGKEGPRVGPGPGHRRTCSPARQGRRADIAMRMCSPRDAGRARARLRCEARSPCHACRRVLPQTCFSRV